MERPLHVAQMVPPPTACASAPVRPITTLKLPSPGRGRWSLDERDAETAFYARLFSAPSLCATLEGALPAGRGNLPLADFLLGLVDAARAAD